MSKKAQAIDPVMAEDLISSEKKEISLKDKKSIARKGMTISLGALFVSGFVRKGYPYKAVHIASGFALAGFSLWHHLLNTKKK